MRRSYLEYKDPAKLQQVVAEISWGQHMKIAFVTKYTIICDNENRINEHD